MSISVRQTMINGHSCEPPCSCVLKRACVGITFCDLAYFYAFAHPLCQYKTSQLTCTQLFTTFSQVSHFLFFFSLLQSSLTPLLKKWMHALAIIMYKGFGVPGRTVYAALKKKISTGTTFSTLFPFWSIPTMSNSTKTWQHTFSFQNASAKCLRQITP